MIRSAVAMAWRACSATSCCRPVASASQPPVSWTVKRLSSHSAG
ncbi:Uncharacterised protein [Mycobacteroides abscessus subsp. abscessus]|nr:Uncharacterised protein [Mycobacteroides abscessus subsp. abscessus]